ncbi:DUF3182 family protein [Pseudomonas sp. CDFA 553]|uniref:DUF3182 family protein n=1 Tax=Pseudomonas quasicaspiana TaxID=2829821 RepID=UPI001E627181|nr:DUF3182 family protein [Pseudomonas quasicaspiana]MCD5989452.1 DUF3182 family protein [Pseudomonas quasicaspiana]
MSGSGSSTEKAAVVLLPTHKKLATHEVVVHQKLAEKIATLLGCEFLGLYDNAIHKGMNLYFIPSDTLIGKQQNIALNIQSFDDLFGGLIAEPFMATKAISHPLLDEATAQPPGWSRQIHEDAADSVLAGFTVFNEADALRAGERVLANGAARIKPVLATAGRGQIVVTDQGQLQAAIAEQAMEEVATWGLVIEEDLTDVITLSVGLVQVAGITASYHGTQCLTEDNKGETVYGGSTLWIVRGGYEALLALELDEPVRRAVTQAMHYENAALKHFPDFIASRRNYDIAQGTNAKGERCSGVLEQSWRIGGASPAEVEALLAFAADPALQRICASTHEIYGETTIPADASVLYEGDDPEVGFISKFTKVRPYECKQ